MNHIETTIWISHYPNLIVQIVLHIQIIPIPVGKECLLLKWQICQITITYSVILIGKFIKGNNPKHGSSYNGKLSDYIIPKLRLGSETSMGSLLFLFNPPSSIEKLKIEVIKRTIKLNDGIVKLSSIHLINPHFDLTNQVGNLYFVDYLDMMFIIVANSSYIIGFNVVLFVSGETVSPNMEWSKCETLNK